MFQIAKLTDNSLQVNTEAESRGVVFQSEHCLWKSWKDWECYQFTIRVGVGVLWLSVLIWLTPKAYRWFSFNNEEEEKCLSHAVRGANE